MIKRKLEYKEYILKMEQAVPRHPEIKLPKDARRARREIAFLDLILIRLKIIY